MPAGLRFSAFPQTLHRSGERLDWLPAEVGLQFGRLVLTLAGAPAMAGAIPCDGVEAAVECLARRLLKLPLL